MKPDEKLLTVIVPSYNMEEYLPRCLHSLVVSDPDLLKRLDVIVVNDGSKDRTSEIAHQFEKDYPGVFRVIDKGNGNYGSCINAGLFAAKGLYVRTLDADDEYDTSAFCRYLAWLRNTVEAGNPPDVVFNDFVKIDLEDKEISHTSYQFTGEANFSLADFDYDTKPLVWIHAIAYKTNILRTIGYRQTEGISYTDQEWDTIPMLHVQTTGYCPETVYRYRCGRQEQTCNAAVLLRNFGMHIPIACRILSEYVASAETASAPNRTLVVNQIKAHIRYFYVMYLITHHRDLNDQELVKYDKLLLQLDKELSDYASSLSASVIHFHYVVEWRRKHTRKTLKFVIFYAIKDLAAAMRRCKSFLLDRD